MWSEIHTFSVAKATLQSQMSVRQKFKTSQPLRIMPNSHHVNQPSYQTATMRPPSQPLKPISDHDTNSVMCI